MANMQQALEKIVADTDPTTDSVRYEERRSLLAMMAELEAERCEQCGFPTHGGDACLTY